MLAWEVVELRLAEWGLLAAASLALAREPSAESKGELLERRDRRDDRSWREWNDLRRRKLSVLTAEEVAVLLQLAATE